MRQPDPFLVDGTADLILSTMTITTDRDAEISILDPVLHRRGAAHPLAIDLLANALTSKGALAVGKSEAQLPALLLHRQRKARDVGDNAVAASTIISLPRTSGP